MIHNTSNTGKYWDQRGQEGFSVGPALQHYRCIQAIDGKTKALIITDTAEYLHIYLTQPHTTAEDRMTHAINFLQQNSRMSQKVFATHNWLPLMPREQYFQMEQ